jgi:integrase
MVRGLVRWNDWLTNIVLKIRGRIYAESSKRIDRACDIENQRRWALRRRRRTWALFANHRKFPLVDIPRCYRRASKENRLAILSAVRSGEVRGARWEEIDLAARVWTIPAERMKKEKEHRIPLSDAAVKLLESLPRYEGDSRVFPAEKAAELSDMALLLIIQRMHKKKLAADGVGWTDPKSNNRIITVHGFRSTFRDWAGETTAYPREVCEHALAHRLPDRVEAAYQRGDLFMKRKGLMTDWAQYCGTVQTAKGDNVVSIQNRKAV